MNRRQLVVLAASAILALGVGACGGDGDADSDGSETQTEQPGAQGQAPSTDALQAFTDCLREQGVAVPDEAPRTQGGGGEPPLDPMNADTQEALQACQDELPEGAGPGGGGSGPPPGGGGSSQ